MATSGKRTARRAETKTWRARALQLHIDGWSMREIARKVGKALSSVHEGIEAELAEITAPHAEQAQKERERKREIEGARLDAVIRGHLKKARGGDAEAAHVVISAVRQRAKLFGLEAPTKVEHGGRDGAPITTMAFDMSKLTDEQLERVLAGDFSALTGGDAAGDEGGGGGGEGTT